MALSFAKKKPVENGAAPSTNTSSTGAVATPSWGKKGAAAKQAMAHEEAKAEERKAEAGKLWRFRMKPGGEAQITFLDGNVDKDGDLDILYFYEHTLHLNGEWQNFICTAETDQSQPCPICEAGDRPNFVGVMTVIDHTPHTVQKGQNAGKIIQNTRKLFVAKQQTLDILRKLAVKRGGLTGCIFDVMRGDDKTAAVGSQFDFQEKLAFPAIAEKYGMKVEEFAPANYGEEIRYRTPEELIALGAGKATTGPGTAKKTGTSSLANEL